MAYSRHITCVCVCVCGCLGGGKWIKRMWLRFNTVCVCLCVSGDEEPLETQSVLYVLHFTAG